MSQYSDDYTEVRSVTCTKETAQAILIALDTGRSVWIPKSQLGEDSEVYAEGTNGTLILKTWLAEQEGLD
jgi:hypothetical protein